MVVLSKIIRKRKTRLKRWARRRKLALTTASMLFLMAAYVYTSAIQSNRLTADPTTYTPLLNLIAKAESKDNYNAYFGNAGNTTINFTDMSIAEVMVWQASYVQQGSASNAVGRYQIISTTLAGLMRELQLDPHQRFDQATQDRMAIALLQRRGAEQYLNDELTRDQFAANLAQEWAALPRVIGDQPDKSYYAADGLNESLVTVAEVLHAVEPISAQ